MGMTNNASPAYPVVQRIVNMEAAIVSANANITASWDEILAYLQETPLWVGGTTKGWKDASRPTGAVLDEYFEDNDTVNLRDTTDAAASARMATFIGNFKEA